MGPKRVHKFGDKIDAVEIQPNPVDTPHRCSARSYHLEMRAPMWYMKSTNCIEPGESPL